MHHKFFPTTPPTCIDVTLEENTTFPIFWFNFLSSLRRHHLLWDDIYGNLANLNVNQKDQWLPYHSNSGELMELMDEEWFSHIVCKLDLCKLDLVTTK
jgi:hypothetical protein